MSNEAREAKADGMARANDNADVRWLVDADHAILRLAQSRDSFTADDVWALLSAKTHEHRAMGPRMQHAARQGWIEKAGFVLSNRPSRHQAPIQVWRSLLARKTL
jgi:hypothetical protein